MRKITIPKKCANLLTDYIDRKFISQVDLDEGVLLLFSQPTYFVDGRYFYAVKDQIKSKGITPVLYENIDNITEYLRVNEIDTIYIDFDRETVSKYNEYKEKFSCEIKDCSKELKRARKFKTADEIESVKKACDITQRAFYEMLKTVKAGVSEKTLAERIERLMVEYGAEGTSFETIVAFGENSAVPHHRTGDKLLQKDMPILVDVGCKVNGYCSDFTRTVFFGKPSEEFEINYELVKKAHLDGIDKIKAGVSGKMADAIARDYFELKGKGKYFTHSLGHGVGLEIHEEPYLSKRSNDLIEDGMIFTVEPGLYFDGEYGIRIEDTVVMVNGRAKTFYNDGKDLIII